MTDSEVLKQPSGARLVRAAGIVMTATVLARLLGLVRQVILGQLFGTTVAMDAFVAANRVPETLYLVVAGGALASAFIPVFTGLFAKGDRPGAWRLASRTANLILLVVVSLSILTAILARPIVSHVLVPQMPVEGQELTIELLWIMLVSTAIFSVSGLLMGVLNARQHFLLPALAPILYNLGIIGGALLLSPSMGIHGVAVGVVVGAMFHLLVQLPGLRGQGASYTLGFGWGNQAVRQVARLMGPRILGLAVTQVNFWVNINLASAFGEGAVSALEYAMRVMLLPLGVVAQAVGIAAFPTFAELVAQGELEKVRRTLVATLRGVLYLALPATAGLYLLRVPIIQLLFERGEFTAESTISVAWALAFYAVGLAGHAVLEIVVRAFYALHDTRTPVGVGSAAMALNVVLSIALSRFFAAVNWMPHGGLALANSLATIIEALCLLYLLRGRMGGIEGRWLLTGVLQSGLATAGMGVGIWLWLALWPGGSALWVGGIGIGLGGSIYLGLTALLRMDELRLLRRVLKRG
jgi:putative peptidoglycan lipid II flippase